VIVLNTIKLHTIWYACTSLLDKYCEKRDMVLQDNVFTFSHWRAFNFWDSVFPLGHKGMQGCPTFMYEMLKQTTLNWPCRVKPRPASSSHYV